MLDYGTDAVKKLVETVDIDEKKLTEEIHCLLKPKHKNTVRFLGYCSDTQGEMVDCEGDLVLADALHRLLWFDYLPKRSLDASHGDEWRRGYQIMNGICDDLYYLHRNKVIHFDLKPTNILLDYNGIPKIADLDLSWCFDEKQIMVITSNLIGTIGYLAPEFHVSRQITFKSDIYSLGVIIMEIPTGEKGYALLREVYKGVHNGEEIAVKKV